MHKHALPSTINAIGGTPVVCLGSIVPPRSAEVLVKLEYFNPTGTPETGTTFTGQAPACPVFYRPQTIYCQPGLESLFAALILRNS